MVGYEGLFYYFFFTVEMIGIRGGYDAVLSLICSFSYGFLWGYSWEESFGMMSSIGFQGAD